MARRVLQFDGVRPALKWLRGRVSDRKFRLLAVAACRHVFPAAALTPEWAAAVEVIERYADGGADGEELAREQLASLARVHGIRAASSAYADWQRAVRHEEIIRGAAQSSGFGAAWTSVNLSMWACSNEIGEDMRRPTDRMGDLLYDVCGQLNWEGEFLPGWRSPDALRLAAGIYGARAFADLPVLADALEDAGCGDAELLGHCRGGVLHVRGCWALDLVLGKE